MKVDVFTFQNAINLGAYLQAYALKKVVGQMGADVFFPYKFSIWGQKYDILAKKMPKLKFNIIRYKKFIKAQKVFNTSGLNSDCDLLIVGSDSIWDISEKTSGYIPEMFGINVKSKKKIAYAASFGTLTDETVVPDVALCSLENFDGLSVRDLNSKYLLEKYHIPCNIVLDPTLLCDFDDIAEEVNIKEKFIMIYGSFPKELIAELNKLKLRLGLKLISVGTYNDWCDESIPVSPGEFIGYIKKAEYVITSMYHGSIFAMKNHKQFISYFTRKRLTKSETTFTTLKMENRLIDNSFCGSIEDLLCKKIDYSIFEKSLEKEREKSLKYLRKYVEE